MRSSAGSGRQLRPDTRVRTRRSAPGCRRRSGHGGFGRQAAWQRRTLCLRRRRCRGGIWRSPIESRSRSGVFKDMECARSPAGWRGRRRRSRGSCAAMPPHGPAAWSTERRRPSVACGSRRAPTQAGEARDQYCAATVRAGAVVRRDHRAKRRYGPEARGDVDGTPARAAAAAAVGSGMESRADCSAHPARLPRR